MLKSLVLFYVLFHAYLGFASTGADACQAPKSNQDDNFEAHMADVTLSAHLDANCVGVNKDYIKKIFSTSAASKEHALMEFQEQSFCFRKADGSVAGCNLGIARQLASVTKVLSMGYAYEKYPDFKLKVTASFTEESGELCLGQNGLTQISESELKDLYSQLPDPSKFKGACVHSKLLYDGDGSCSSSYSHLMHSQTDTNLDAAKDCANTNIKKHLQKFSGKTEVTFRRGDCRCGTEYGNITKTIKEYSQSIMAASDSWQLRMIYDKLGTKGREGLEDYVRAIAPEPSKLSLGSEMNASDVTGNSSGSMGVCEAILDIPTIKTCQNPPLPCGDTPGATFEHMTNYSEGTTIPSLGGKHKVSYEKWDNDFCGKTGTAATSGVKNLVGCFHDQSLNRPITAFALMLQGKESSSLGDMAYHSVVMKDFYQHLLNPETQNLLLEK